MCLLVASVTAACATPEIDRLARDELRDRVGASTERPDGTAFELPPDVKLADGVTSDEAVAIALWNDPSFRQSLAQLGIARADWVAAGMLRNPSVSVLFPLGAKQLEFTIAWLVDALWMRGRRMETTRLRWEGSARALVETGWSRALQVRTSHADAMEAAKRAELAWLRVGIADRRARIDAERLGAGEVDSWQVAASRIGAIEARERARTADLEAALARRSLARETGFEADAEVVLQASTGALPEPGSLSEAVETATATRAAVEAARLGLDAAGARLGLERWQILRVAAVVDANGDGEDGFEIGPGLDIELPLFDRNQAGLLRARAELEAAAWAYRDARRRVRFEARDAHAAYVRAKRALDVWTGDVLTAVDSDARLVSEQLLTGVVSFERVLEVEDRRVRVQETGISLEGNARRALALLERSLGRKLDEGA